MNVRGKVDNVGIINDPAGQPDQCVPADSRLPPFKNETLPVEISAVCSQMYLNSYKFIV